MRTPTLFVVLSLAVAGCHGPAAARRSALPQTPIGSPGAPGTSRIDLDHTVQTMTARLERDPDDGAAAVRLADAELRRARVLANSAPAVQAERAVRRWLARKASENSPYHYQARLLLATALASQHRFEEAIREAEGCLQAHPNDAMAFGIIGDSKLELGDRAGAFAAFERMAAIRPDESSYARISYARELSGDRDEAIRLMAMALEATSPNDPEALAWHHAQLGSLQFAAGRLDGAAREFEHAAFLFPDYPIAIEGQARVAHTRGQHAAALALIDPLVAGTPSSSALALSADILRALGRADEADRRASLAEAVRITETARGAAPGAAIGK